MANDKNLSADPVTLQERLKDDVQLVCPLFQRKYVWKAREIDQLWEDIDTILDGTSERRFLGALVFADVENSSSTSAGKYLVIDGQQRLTTLVLSIIAIAERSASLGAKGKDLADGLVHEYILSRKANTKNQPKLAPTLKDTHQFNTILRNAFGEHFLLDINESKEIGPAEGTMEKAYTLLQKKVLKRTQPEPDAENSEQSALDKIVRLMDTVLDHLEFVEIRLGDEHDPNEVFDRLNKEGVRLGIVDLVRNEVLKRLSDEPKLAMQLHSQEWQPFEQAFGEDGSALDGYFYPYALTIDSAVTKAKVFSMLTKRWNADFKGTGADPETQLKQIMAGLKSHVVSYNAIARGELSKFDEDLSIYVQRLVDLNRPSSVYPYVMQLLTAYSLGNVEATETQTCLQIVESFLVRRALLGIEPTGLHAIFKGMWESAGADPALVRQSITSTTVVFPSDSQVREAIVDSSMYSRKILRYAMAEYERDISTVDVMKQLPEITIDHVMPQSGRKEWAEVITPADFDRVVNTWGNLVPLSGNANSSKNAKNWETARKLLQHETVFSTTKQVYANHEEWNFETIRARSEQIVQWAIERWPNFNDLLTGDKES